MHDAQIIVAATPVFLLLIAVEFFVGLRRGKNTYRLNDALSSIGLGIMSQLTDVFAKALTLGVYIAAHEHLALWQLSPRSAWVWVTGLLLYDLLYYWHHRLGHRCAFLWAAHVVHHQSEDYNLSTALRQPSTYWIAGWVFYLPMAIAGFPPLVFAVVALVDLLYQYWVHTQQIGRLGWFDRVFCSPSNHRVHHAVNEKYLDRNFGGILILWDRLFGTFVDKPPGWRPVDVAARFPKPTFSIEQVRRFDPPTSRASSGLSAVLFLLLLLATSALLWNAHVLGAAAKLGWVLAIIAGLWLMARVSDGAGGTRAGSATPAQDQVA